MIRCKGVGGVADVVVVVVVVVAGGLSRERDRARGVRRCWGGGRVVG